MDKNSWKNLDMVCIKVKESDREVVVYINSSAFFRSKIGSLQKDDRKYASTSLLEEVWALISLKRYKKASNLLDEISVKYSLTSSGLFAKFVVSLFLKENAFPHLKECVFRKNSNDHDDEYRLYLELYKNMGEDVEELFEYLSKEREIVAFNKNSFNGNYLELKKAIKEKDFKLAKKKLGICKKMQPTSFHLEILEQLLILMQNEEEELRKRKKQQEKELEKERCQRLISFIKEKDFNHAKEQVELILESRNGEHKSNHSYHLILEILEIVSIFEQDITFEVPKVSYIYQDDRDFLYNFLEAISIGDLKTALEIGRKCRNKPLDSSEPKLKVGTYLIILEYLLNSMDARLKEQDKLYKIVQNNIQRGHFIHALELYQNNQVTLKHYQSDLLLDLFQSGIAIEKQEIPFANIYHGGFKREERKQERLSIESISSIVDEKEPFDAITLKDEEKKEILVIEDSISKEADFEETPKEEVKENQEEIKEEVLYPVEPLLVHTEPNQEYFIYFTKCLEFGQYEESKYWLTQYGSLLKANQLQKRLDHYYYMAEISYAESMEEKNLFSKKQELYQLAYSAMRNYDYNRAITYLEYYEKMDTCRNNKALILKGYVYRKMGKYDTAMKCFIQANSISPNPDAYYFLGDIYYKLHRFKDAIFCYITYNEFYPKENISVYLNLSECYRKLNNSNKSLKYLKIADEINTNQNRGLNLKNRILRTEMANHKKEKFRLKKEEKVN